MLNLMPRRHLLSQLLCSHPEVKYNGLILIQVSIEETMTVT